MILRLGAAVVAMMTLVPSATRFEADDFATAMPCTRTEVVEHALVLAPVLACLLETLACRTSAERRVMARATWSGATR